MKFKGIRVSKRNQTQKDKYYMVPLIKVPRLVKFIENRMLVARAWGLPALGVTFNRCRVPVWDDEKVLETDGGDGCTTV